MLRFESEKEHVLVFTFILARQEKVTLLRVNDSSFDGLLILAFLSSLRLQPYWSSCQISVSLSVGAWHSEPFEHRYEVRIVIPQLERSQARVFNIL